MSHDPRQNFILKIKDEKGIPAKDALITEF